MIELGAVVSDASDPASAARDPASAARSAERAGLDSVWAGDHLVLGSTPLLDAPLVLAAAAAATERLGVGTAVFLPALRPPVSALRQVSTLALLAGGRLRLGVGTGAGPVEEYGAAGVPRAERGPRTDAFLALLPAALAGEPVEVPGVPPVELLPAAPMPPVWIGGSSRRALQRAVAFGDGWLGSLLTAPEFAHAAAHLDELARDAPRQRPRLGLVVHAALGERPDPALRRLVTGVLRGAYGLDDVRAARLAVAGTPAEVADQLAPFVAAGAELVVVVPHGAAWDTGCDLLADLRQRLAVQAGQVR